MIDRHDLPASVLILILLGSIISIGGLLLYLSWVSRRNRQKSPPKRPTSRKKKGRKPYW